MDFMAYFERFHLLALLTIFLSMYVPFPYNPVIVLTSLVLESRFEDSAAVSLLYTSSLSGY